MFLSVKSVVNFFSGKGRVNFVVQRKKGLKFVIILLEGKGLSCNQFKMVRGRERVKFMVNFLSEGKG